LSSSGLDIDRLLDILLYLLMSMEYDDGSIEHYFNKQPDKSYYQKYLKLLTNKPMLEEFR